MNGPAQNQGPRATNCPAIAPLLPFYACDELNAAERGQVDAHLAQCAACGEQLKQERRLLEALDEMLQPADRLNPSDTLLAQQPPAPHLEGAMLGVTYWLMRERDDRRPLA